MKGRIYKLWFERRNKYLLCEESNNIYKTKKTRHREPFFPFLSEQHCLITNNRQHQKFWRDSICMRVTDTSILLHSWGLKLWFNSLFRDWFLKTTCIELASQTGKSSKSALWRYDRSSEMLLQKVLTRPLLNQTIDDGIRLPGVRDNESRY